MREIGVVVLVTAALASWLYAIVLALAHGSLEAVFWIGFGVAISVMAGAEIDDLKGRRRKEKLEELDRRWTSYGRDHSTTVRVVEHQERRLEEMKNGTEQ